LPERKVLCVDRSTCYHIDVRRPAACLPRSWGQPPAYCQDRDSVQLTRPTCLARARAWNLGKAEFEPHVPKLAYLSRQVRLLLLAWRDIGSFGLHLERLWSWQRRSRRNIRCHRSWSGFAARHGKVAFNSYFITTKQQVFSN